MKQTLILVLVVLLLGGYVWFIEQTQPTTDEHREQAQHLLALEPDEVTAVRIEREDGVVAVVKQDGQWRMEAPLSTPADDGAVSSFLYQVAGAQALRVVEPPEGQMLPLVEYGLAPAAVTLQVTTTHGPQTVRFGGATPVGNERYAQVDGRSPVAVVEASVVELLTQPVEAFRRKELLDLNREDVSRITATRGRETVSLERVDGAWRLVRPVREPADLGAVDTYLGRVSWLRADGFVSDAPGPDLAALGLSEPELVVSLGLSSAGADGPAASTTEGAEPEVVDVRISGDVHGARHAVTSQSGTIYRLPTTAVEGLMPTVPEFRDRRVLHVDRTTIDRIEISGAGGQRVFERSGDTWRDPEDAATDARDTVEDLLAQVERLSSVDRVDAWEQELSVYGFDHPAVALTLSQGTVVRGRVLIGSAVTGDEGRVYATNQDRRFVYYLPTYLVDRLTEWLPSPEPPVQAQDPDAGAGT